MWYWFMYEHHHSEAQGNVEIAKVQILPVEKSFIISLSIISWSATYFIAGWICSITEHFSYVTLLFLKQPLVKISLQDTIMLVILSDMLHPAFLKETEEMSRYRCTTHIPVRADKLMITSTCVEECGMPMWCVIMQHTSSVFLGLSLSLAQSLTLERWPWAILLFISGQRRADCLLPSYLYGTQTSSGMPVAFRSVSTVISIAVLNQTGEIRQQPWKIKVKVLLSCPSGAEHFRGL